MSVPPDVAGVLRDAADLIEPEGCWTQGVEARGKSGRPVYSDGRHAVSFCMVGAIRRVASVHGPCLPAIRAVQQRIGTGASIWNDNPSRTQAEVVQTLREVAAS